MAKRKEPVVEIEFARLCRWATWAAFVVEDGRVRDWLLLDLQRAVEEYKAKEATCESSQS